ncbi:hypothetical protein GH714_038200 [Hevea brasiliensis]|uniref:PGG domain-containing protein n=1 Tax=Hevea brasiliensis TaxID=3981 RepID=A0A6A6MRB2_HEVBR|nr:hypothetical protein GH714_038200 [Hevea brasiliensis]
MYEAFQFLLHWVCHEEDFYLKKKFLDHRDVEGNTLLHIATSRNQPQFVRLLIDQGVDIKAKNSENMTALAIAQGQELENNEVKDILHDAEDSALPSYFYDYCLRITAADSPVHIAARKGNTTFVLEIVSLKPSLARKLNQHGLSPIHLALQEGQTQTVIGLMRIDSELIRLRGKDGITPLHYVAEMGDVVLLSKFLRSCPSSIHDLTVHCQTAVHIAVKKKKLAAFEFLFGWLHRRNMEEILNWKDDEGNTVLHIAVQENEPRVLRIRDTYLGVSAENENPASDVRDIILVVAVLIATATYQAVLSPPGGFWGDNYDPPGNTTNASVIDGQQKPHRAARMDRLLDATVGGSIDSLYAAIGENPHILAHIEEIPIVDTPLHVAASAGHIQYATEIMRLKTSFARKSNQDGFNPIHIALQKEHFHLLLCLVDMDCDLVRQRREGLLLCII